MPVASSRASSLLAAAEGVNNAQGVRFASHGAAFLARQGVETAMDGFWLARAPGVEVCSMRTQLICAPFHLPHHVAAGVNHTWWALTRVCHHHAYDLPPTPEELGDLLETARGLVAELARLAGAERE